MIFVCQTSSYLIFPQHHLFFIFIFFLLFIRAYNVWVISPPVSLAPSLPSLPQHHLKIKEPFLAEHCTKTGADLAHRKLMADP
jgi:hypothetical protein